MALIDEGRVILAEDRQGEPTGFVCLLPCQDGACELDGMFVDPDRWRGGVGRRLLEAASDLARREGASSIHVIANPAAMAFYLTCGFREAGTAETQFGPAQTMRLALHP